MSSYALFLQHSSPIKEVSIKRECIIQWLGIVRLFCTQPSQHCAQSLLYDLEIKYYGGGQPM